MILVRENEPKSKETTVNYFALRHCWSIEEYTHEKSELLNQDARVVWAFLISSLEVARYDCLTQRFPLTFQLLVFSVKIKKKSNFQLMF